MQNIIKTQAIIAVLIFCFYFSKAQTVTDTAKSKLLAEKELQTINVSSAKPFIVLSAGKTTLNVAQSPVASGSNVYDIIKKAPGIAEQSSALSYKGKSTRVLINGRPANVSGEDLKVMLSSMPGTNVDKVELLSNPSSRYDAEGGAVINIILKKNKAFGTNYTLNSGVGAGKYLKANTGLDFNYREKDINIYGGYSFNHSRQYTTLKTIRSLSNGTISALEYEEKNRNSKTYKLGIDWDLTKKSTLGFLVNGLSTNRDRVANNSSVLHYNSNITDSMTQVFTNGRTKMSGPMVNIYFKTKLDSTGKELTLNTDYMHYTKNRADNFTNTFYDDKGNEYAIPTHIINNSPSGINVYSFTADYVQPVKKGKWEAGLKSSYTSTGNNVLWQNNSGNGWITDEGKTNHFIYKEYVNAAYVNYSREIKKWSIQTGLRAELTNTVGNSVTLNQVNKKTYLNVFPNADVQFNKNENNQFGFNYRKSIRRYGFNYVNPFTIYQNQYAYSQGNPQIVPELSNNLELSYTYKQAYSFSLNYSHGKRTLGEIYLKGDNNTTISSYGNYNSSDIVYISVSAYQPLTKYWITSINPMAGYMMLNNTSTLAAATSNENILVTQLNWMNNFTFKKNWNAEFSVMYISPFQYGSYKTKTLITADMGISKNILKNKASVSLSVSDIFNSLVYNKEVNYGSIVATVDQKEESRFINMAFKYKFGNSNVKAKAQRSSKLKDIQNRIN